MSTTSNIIRKHFIFHGDVQGVGFRYRAYYAALAYNVTGWVRNLLDGTVEMEAEGTERDINAIVATLKEGHYISIDWIEEKPIPTLGSRTFERR